MASTLLATVMVLLLLNAACSLAFVLRDGFSPQGTSPVQQKYDSVEWAAVYPDLEVEQIERRSERNLVANPSVRASHAIHRKAIQGRVRER